MSQPTNKKSHLLPLVLLIILIGSAAVAVERVNLYDWWRLRNYAVPPAVARLASDDTMTPYARTLFYINYPDITGKVNFNNQCPNADASESIVLGCYHGNEGGIYLLSVTDPLLNGVEQVTAAHEMLHGAYDRLSSAQKDQLDSELMDYYQHDLTDPRIKAEIAIYQKTEPNAVLNEMHSTFGTEVAVLPAPLEQYYSTLFSDRSKIVAYANQYEAQFTTRQTTVTADDTQLAALKSQFTTLQTSLKATASNISAEQQALTAERTTNPIAYNQAVPGFNSQVNQYNDGVTQLQSLVSQYNQLVNARNSVALSETKLANDLTADVAPISK